MEKNTKKVKISTLIIQIASRKKGQRKRIVKTKDETLQISGSVLDENHIRIVNVMGFDIDLNPSGPMLFVVNKDIPGVIGNIGSLLGMHNVNIAEYLLGRLDSDDIAYGVIKLDSKIDDDILSSLYDLDEITSVKQISIDEF